MGNKRGGWPIPDRFGDPFEWRGWRQQRASFPARNHPGPQPVKILIFTALQLQTDAFRADFISRVDFPAHVESVTTRKLVGHLSFSVWAPEILSVHFLNAGRDRNGNH